MQKLTHFTSVLCCVFFKTLVRFTLFAVGLWVFKLLSGSIFAFLKVFKFKLKDAWLSLTVL